MKWVAISFSNAWKWKVKLKSLSRVGLIATPWTAAYQAPPSMGFSRQEYWSDLPLPSPSVFLSLFEACWFCGFLLFASKLIALGTGALWRSSCVSSRDNLPLTVICGPLPNCLMCRNSQSQRMWRLLKLQVLQYKTSGYYKVSLALNFQRYQTATY